MSDKPDVLHQLDQLIQHSYYAEYSELDASIRALVADLNIEDEEILTAEVIRRLKAEPSLVELTFCSCLNVKEAVPYLIHLLDTVEEANQTSRIIIKILSSYPGDESYRAVSRFLDSGQHAEALAALTKLNFPQAIHALRRALAQDGLYTTCIHILKQRFETVDRGTFMEELAQIGDVPLARKRLEAVFSRTQGEHNPFPQEITASILDWARRSD